MSRVSPSAILLSVLLVSWAKLAVAQGPLRVEVLGDIHRSWEPITVRVTNLTDKAITPVPIAYLSRKGRSVRTRLPAEVEKKTGDTWITIPPTHEQGYMRGPSQLEPGKSFDYQLAVVGPGEYRARVWYVSVPGDPPRRRATFSSVVSSSFVVVPRG